MTKNYYHEEICALMGDHHEERFYLQSEAETDGGFRLSHDGYQEFYCDFCGNFHPSRKCETAEQYRAQMNDDDLPF